MIHKKYFLLIIFHFFLILPSQKSNKPNENMPEVLQKSVEKVCDKISSHKRKQEFKEFIQNALSDLKTQFKVNLYEKDGQLVCMNRFADKDEKIMWFMNFTGLFWVIFLSEQCLISKNSKKNNIMECLIGVKNEYNEARVEFYFDKVAKLKNLHEIIVVPNELAEIIFEYLYNKDQVYITRANNKTTIIDYNHNRFEQPDIMEKILIHKNI